MGLREKLGRRLTAWGAALGASPPSESGAAAAGVGGRNGRAELEVAHDVTRDGVRVRAWRRGGALDLAATVGGAVYRAERGVLLGGQSAEEVVARFEEGVAAGAPGAKAVILGEAETAVGEADRLARVFMRAKADMERAREAMLAAERDLPVALWHAERWREWMRALNGTREERRVPEALQQAGMAREVLARGPFPEAWLEAAAAPGEGRGNLYRGSAGPGRGDVERVVVVRHPGDALDYHVREGAETPVHYICVGTALDGDAASSEGRAQLAWELRALLERHPGGSLPVVVAATRGQDVHLEEAVGAQARPLGLALERWESRFGAGRDRAVQRTSSEARSRAPAAPAGLLALGFSESFLAAADPVLVREALLDAAGRQGEARPVLARSARNREMVVAERALDALAYCAVAGPQEGRSMLVVGPDLPAALAQPGVRPALESVEGEILVAFGSGRDGAALARDFRGLLDGVRAKVVRREPRYGRSWGDALRAKEKGRSVGKGVSR